MPTPAEILDMTASLMNDTRQSMYTHKAMLPYFNMSLRALQEEFELNNIPVTDEVSSSLVVLAGVDTIAAIGTTPVYPFDLIEVREMWESQDGLNQWIPMNRVAFLPHYLEDNVPVSQFSTWAWIDNEIRLVAANAIIDLKLNYIKSLFPTITDTNFDNDLGVRFKTIFNYLGFKTAAYCSMFIGENPTRAQALNAEGNDSLVKSLGISIKGQQVLGVRRQPFMAGYKRKFSY